MRVLSRKLLKAESDGCNSAGATAFAICQEIQVIVRWDVHGLDGGVRWEEF